MRKGNMGEWKESVTKAQAGDLKAFGSLVERFQDMAVGYAYSILSDFDHAEDAVQSAFIEAYQKLGDLQEPLAFPAWLRRIVFKHCDRQTRDKRVPTVSLEHAAETPSDSPGPHRIAEKREIHKAVLEAVGSLPEKERAATTLFYIDGYSQSEVADFLDVPVTTVKNRLHKARNMLREGLLEMVSDTLKSSAPDDSFGRAVRAKIENLQWTTRWLTHLGCLEGCTRYLGLDVSPEWLAGGSGYAFAMRLHEELCPAGIIAWAPPDALGRNVGYETSGIAPDDEDVAKQQKAVWTATNEALDQGIPCIGFAMEAWQSYIIYGYDDDGYFYQPVHEGGDGHFPKRKMGVDVPCVMTFIKRADPADDSTAVREALKFAVQYASNPDIAPGWGGDPAEFADGLAGYDLWIKSIESGRADGHGMGFNAQVFAELRRMAVGFLKEAAKSLKMQAEFKDAIRQYEVVASSLGSVADLFPLPADPEHMKDDDRCRAALDHLRTARCAEAAGLKHLQELLEKL